jgi:hypothetical protein
LSLHSVFGVAGEVIGYGKMFTHAVWQKEVCGLHKDLIGVLGHEALKAFDKKVSEASTVSRSSRVMFPEHKTGIFVLFFIASAFVMLLSQNQNGLMLVTEEA